MTPPVDLSQLTPALETLRRLPGVTGAGVVEDGEPADVWVELESSAAVEHAMAAALRERHALKADQLRWQEETGAFGASGRLQVDRLLLRGHAGSTSAEVLLRSGDRTAPGSSASEEAGDEAAEIIGEAALDRAVTGALLLALEELTEDAVIATIEAVELVDAGETATVRLRLDIDGEEVAVAGSAAVLGHRPQAVARAVLGAVEPHLPE